MIDERNLLSVFRRDHCHDFLYSTEDPESVLHVHCNYKDLFKNDEHSREERVIYRIKIPIGADISNVCYCYHAGLKTVMLLTSLFGFRGMYRIANGDELILEDLEENQGFSYVEMLSSICARK